ncbi:hypothetical protein F969_00915 [Acinetobacter variabilis]|uniref:Uncharacterized protein n=1 Tax=Acinetobacter variabilis TaxID=70346 RepID=N8WYP5_9GAMM|nr:hypothetical protein F969_00915 [Acinetobacter variabilis]
MNALQKRKYQFLLKSADVDLKNLMSENELYHCLENFEFKNIQIEDLSEAVFSGFADYVNQHLNSKKLKQKVKRLNRFKIQMTAKLCQKLYQEGIVRYVQVTAQAI